MTLHATLFITLMKKQLTPMSNKPFPKICKEHLKITWQNIVLPIFKKYIFANSKNYYKQNLRQCQINEKLNYIE